MKCIAATVGSGGRRDFFWLNQAFAMQASSPKRGLGFNLVFGGIFVSPPAAVSWMARRRPVVGDFDHVHDLEVADLEVAGGGAGAAVAETADSATTTLERGPLGDVGGPAVLTQRLDLFGLGLDYGLYHKVFWGEFDQNDFGPWQPMGGVFTSAPAAIAWGKRLDVVGVGLDHAMYWKNVSGGPATPDWVRLGGAFTSAASLVARGERLDLFARGSDFTLRGNHTEGADWFGWQNHGGELASPPVAISWGPDRIDIFAIFKDRALWHRWWDGQIWNEWESLGGAYMGEPAAVSWGPDRIDVFVVGADDRRLHHYWFEGDAWSLPETLPYGTDKMIADSVTVVSDAPNHLELFIPTDDGQIRRGVWDGQWQFGSAGANYRAPCRYRLSVDLVRVKTTRALNSDTDAAMASVQAGAAAVRTRTQWIGGIGGLSEPKSSQTNLLEFEPVTIDLAEPMSFSYIVVNNGHAPQAKILSALAAAGDSLSLAGSSSMQEDIAKGVFSIASVKLLGLLALEVPVVGPILGFVENWLMDKLKSAVFESCDGVVAVEMRAMMGRDLFMQTDNGRQPIHVTTKHPGTDSPTLCGSNSEYEVTWTIKPL
jgi:hypothetical protein